MTSTMDPMLPRGDWLRLHTLVNLRWISICGQLSAVAVCDRVLNIHLPLGACYLTVILLLGANIIFAMGNPGNRRLTETEALLTLLFDMSQLSMLIFLTGGLSNPFVLLILAPVVIAASALSLYTTIALSLAAAVWVTVVTVWHLPMVLADGTPLQSPDLFRFGFWLSMVTGIAFTSIYAHRVSAEARRMSEALLATQMALAREQKLTDLGGVVAAAAHELGTPLATIKLVSTELMEELRGTPDLHDDAGLIRDQAERCRDILRAMGQSGKDDSHMRQAPLETLLRDAAEPHLSRGRQVHFRVAPASDGAGPMPSVLRRPEILHGLRNLVQNAVDFSRAEVWVDATWTEGEIRIRISDDGAGFPPQILNRIGEPFVRTRRPAERPGYDGMGLGLFIAKTLLERSGARLRFGNAVAAPPGRRRPARTPRGTGAVVDVTWRRELVESEPGPLRQNSPLLP
ncbi:sensor histidine kinase RegB [Falsirhodobacter algicola]|uniref:histidine kinase n=1 Tax=Falsirhodobacter algicola TaxID=2692330 RepID=A0A8J8MTJ4_9RHOB|nr:ActS/PrrB/RegB family redox-sensitive histidine kinase [Falsirhodobacter algicola]QUS36410.1 ActS/PrrB/RegB family redox-sensitive histidine kinase [Falsirhodobacter algicola]